MLIKTPVPGKVHLLFYNDFAKIYQGPKVIEGSVTHLIYKQGMIMCHSFAWFGCELIIHILLVVLHLLCKDQSQQLITLGKRLVVMCYMLSVTKELKVKQN